MQISLNIYSLFFPLKPWPAATLKVTIQYMNSPHIVATSKYCIWMCACAAANNVHIVIPILPTNTFSSIPHVHQTYNKYYNNNKKTNNFAIYFYFPVIFIMLGGYFSTRSVRAHSYYPAATTKCIHTSTYTPN